MNTTLNNELTAAYERIEQLYKQIEQLNAQLKKDQHNSDNLCHNLTSGESN